MDVQKDDTLDVTGLQCPVPILHTARRIQDLPPGGVLEVLSDDPEVWKDLEAWCRRTGHAFLGAEAAEDGTRIFVRRKND